MSTSPTGTTAIVHSRHSKTRLDSIHRIITVPNGITERSHKCQNIFLSSIIIPFCVFLVSCTHARRKPGSRNFPQSFPSFHFFAICYWYVLVILQFTPICPTAQCNRLLHTLRQLYHRQDLPIFIGSSSGTKMVEHRHAFYNRCCRACKDAIHQILITFSHIFGLRLTAIDFRINFSYPVIIQPTITPIHTNFKIILLSHLLHGTQKYIVLVRKEAPLYKESIDFSCLSRQNLIFNIVGIQI